MRDQYRAGDEVGELEYVMPEFGWAAYGADYFQVSG